MCFPVWLVSSHREYLSYWVAEARRRLQSDFDSVDPNGSSGATDEQQHPDEGKEEAATSFARAYRDRPFPQRLDDKLMDEWERSVEAMPLESEERMRLASTIRAIRELGGRAVSDELYGEPEHGGTEGAGQTSSVGVRFVARGICSVMNLLLSTGGCGWDSY